VLGVGAAVQVDDDAVALKAKRGDHDPVSDARGLSLLVEHLLVLLWSGLELAVGLQRQTGAHGQGAVGKALLCLEIAHQLALASFAELASRQRKMSGGELGVDVCGCGLFAHDEDLGSRDSACQRTYKNWENESARAPVHEGTSDGSHSAPIRCRLTRAAKDYVRDTQGSMHIGKSLWCCNRYHTGKRGRWCGKSVGETEASRLERCRRYRWCGGCWGPSLRSG
jgi:predicted lipoprotein with Yx(FWY)xxD motif